MDAAGGARVDQRHPPCSRWAAAPAVQVDQGGEDAITTLVFKVASLETAKAALSDLGLLGAATATQLTIDPAKVQGLQMVFVQE